MKTKLITGALLLALATPAAAQATPLLTKKDARKFIQVALPPSAPYVLLKDSRSSFFHTTALSVQPAHRCRRLARNRVSCRFRLRMEPDRAHRLAHWFPIACLGATEAIKPDDGNTFGEMRNYKCRTVIPKP